MNIIEADNEQEQRDRLRSRREAIMRLQLEGMRRLQLERMSRLQLEEMRRLRLREVKKQLGPIFDRVVETKEFDKGCMVKTTSIRREFDDFDRNDRARKSLEAFFQREIDDNDDSDDDVPKFGSFKSKVREKMENRLSGTSSSSSSSPVVKKAKKTMITDGDMDPFAHINIEALTSLPTDRTNYP
ncbi:hypothetical protein FRACYDRAFT_234996 [Fragilariopsis cylindrus CCMP1102]|uniref:Uncharacterized protein n=1 Tax=Fragilariopsis cylindrus CCMP1102 TaxID=635003 RepID=A0A1E7FT69_9STRA|nr:hypothetical protein FRACYDRAFT_234996 [Fragilariopsis cylindrus CCMP1102]|eukprot:OEU21372.1 hypothetical protein FRACYDRAFT_234996 [Fragilariopsis cylindrus CCMP1102]